MTTDPDRPRFLPDEPFPSYSFVPGHFPHPIAEVEGHHFAGRPDLPTEGDTWQSNRAFRFGLDLFNFGYYWEAHEVWEGIWHARGRQGPVADFLKGLIQLTASGVKIRQGIPRGVRSLAQGAARLFDSVLPTLAEGETLFGFDPNTLIEYAQRAEQLADSAEPSETLDPVEVVFHFVLIPRDAPSQGKDT